MVISRERFLDDTRRLHVTIGLASRTSEMHSLLTDIGPEGQQRIGEVLARALDEIQHLLAPTASAFTARRNWR